MSKCPFCSEKMVNGECKSCGYREYSPSSISFGDTFEEEPKKIDTVKKVSDIVNNHVPKRKVEPAENGEKKLGIIWKVILIFFSLYMPMVGIIASVSLMFNPNKNYKDFGRKLLFFNTFIIFCSILFIMFTFRGLFWF